MDLPRTRPRGREGRAEVRARLVEVADEELAKAAQQAYRARLAGHSPEDPREVPREDPLKGSREDPVDKSYKCRVCHGISTCDGIERELRPCLIEGMFG